MYQTHPSHEGFEVLTSATMKNYVFWNVMPYSLLSQPMVYSSDGQLVACGLIYSGPP
jgi:hypothetical protein